MTNATTKGSILAWGWAFSVLLLITYLLCVAFGLIKTRLTEATAGSDESIDIEGRKIKVGVNPDLLRNMEAMVPLGRGGTPAEAAGAVYLFCTPESNYVSGQTLICGGGLSM